MKLRWPELISVKVLLICLVLVIQAPGMAQEEYCCTRNLIFPDFPMPSEQERDISGFISTSWESYVMKSGINELLECPLMIEILDYTGVIDLDSMIERITAVSSNKTPEFNTPYENVRGTAEYIWKGRLELTYIERIVPGWTEPAYGGGIEYLPGYVVGGWKFTVQLYDIQHNEVVKEASTTWTGSDIGYYKNLEKEYNAGTSDKKKIDILEELYNREFHNLKQIIWDYEKVPDEAEFEGETIKVDPEKTKRITFQVTDEKGEKPKKWQRLAVKVDFGTLTNGTPCCETGGNAKFYSFMCEEGQVTIEYKAPDHDKSTFDHITVFNGCIIKCLELNDMSMVDIRDEIGDVDIALVNEGYSGTITVTKTWNYTENYGKSSTKHVGKQSVSFDGVFKPIPQMEGMEGQPVRIYGPYKISGTWSHNEDLYCSGDCDCPGLIEQEYGSGDFPRESLQGLIIITNLFPTDDKVVGDQLGQFGLVNWYDIATPTENVPTQTRTRHYVKDAGCQWNNSTSSTNLTGSDARIKLKDINHLAGNVSWSSSTGTTGVSITDMTQAIYDQKPFEPEQDGTDFHYTISWNLKAF